MSYLQVVKKMPRPPFRLIFSKIDFYRHNPLSIALIFATLIIYFIMKDYSAIFNAHPDFIDHLYKDYLQGKEVDEGWKAFFKGYDFCWPHQWSCSRWRRHKNLKLILIKN